MQATSLPPSPTPRFQYFRAVLAWLLALGAGLVLSPAAEPLKEAPSAFLRAQATSAVHWETWNDATLSRARASGRSIYVFIGSPLSELTRATIEQTFSSAKTVAWLNENFFCIFVDSDIEPEVAAYAQYFISSVKQLHGWPVHLWLTPELKPYDGSNYLPPSEEWGKPGYLKAARSALDAWAVNPARARALATEAAALMRPQPLGSPPKQEVKTQLDHAAAAWIATLDAKNGGFGSAPKQPEPELLRFLLSRDAASQNAALNTARALIAGAVNDTTHGGFYRRAIDEEWKEPYRQKTLDEQARIALALLEAAKIAKEDKLRNAALAALDFSLKELRNPDGSYAAALDGTLEASVDATHPPHFVRVGEASTEAQALLIVALQYTGEKRFLAEASALGKRLREQLALSVGGLKHAATATATATAADYAAAALAFRALKNDVLADRLLTYVDQRFFDAALGSYMISAAELPPGITSRVPASGTTPSAEVLALLARANPKTADALRRGLVSSIEYDELPPGEVLLGLASAP